MLAVSDYRTSETVDARTGAKTVIELPKSNVLQYKLPGGSGVIVRPSGTEPKIKLYITTVAADKSSAEALAGTIGASIKKIMNIG